MSKMAKGAGLEELVRAYFARQGYVSIRSVSIEFEDEEVTDADVWLYGRQGGGVRTRALVDVKDKKSPKAFERIMWVRGMQLALNCDRAFVATTDNSPKVARFARQQKVALLSAGFLRNWADGDVLHDRLSLEEYISNIQTYSGQKQDGDWLKQIAAAKSAVVSLAPFPAFNKAIGGFRFFSERAATRPQHREQTLRGAFLCASLACVALDAALEGVVFLDAQARHNALDIGVTYGDSGDNRVRSSIETVLSVISSGIKNGRTIARQTSDALDEMFSEVRAEIIAEFFSNEKNAALLFPVARELEARAHARNRTDLVGLSVEAKAILGVFADFVGAKRSALLSAEFPNGAPPPAPTAKASTTENSSNTTKDGSSAEVTNAEGDPSKAKDEPNPKLL